MPNQLFETFLTSHISRDLFVFTLHQFLVADYVLKFAKHTVNKTQRMNTTELPNPQRDVK